MVETVFKGRPVQNSAGRLGFVGYVSHEFIESVERRGGSRLIAGGYGEQGLNRPSGTWASVGWGFPTLRSLRRPACRATFGRASGTGPRMMVGYAVNWGRLMRPPEGGRYEFTIARRDSIFLHRLGRRLGWFSRHCGRCGDLRAGLRSVVPPALGGDGTRVDR